MTICSTCNRDFDLDAEGGIEGHFGMIPVAFCPECKACVYDMGQQLNYEEDDDESDYPPT